MAHVNRIKNVELNLNTIASNNKTIKKVMMYEMITEYRSIRSQSDQVPRKSETPRTTFPRIPRV
ncbi:hypothetical protein AmFV_159 [Apis mellifera filamentous virus]|uniref:hypothetical protein n=1 Tax=Apis mellifera filamentous virus TaxID=1100043 RepID=UPI0006BC9FE7|nr:hypothetical protein APL35_gp159 [Apis mellifera filamentous virus]AKY03228.1 hypothetical protein [Apis mellifera filamentous virus]UQL06640.1 hypothetical protein AmFV_159 [Apis mellifera filamentous virus]WLJ60334.1 MAG: hypothetical protein AmFV_00183 [Apis mellifera filamentous virus]WOK43300.1 MAG: hypothetical protein [Apis mellifera filamentous virus]WOK43605.1 MAG: hypothetical protein [Apis mellifera filamentous virus]